VDSEAAPKTETEASPDPYAEIVSSVETWLAPFAGSSSSGTDARHEMPYEQLRAEVNKLTSPRAEPVAWQLVSERGQTILTEKSKDLIIMAHVAVALYYTEGIEGFLRGTAGLVEVIDRYWDNLFPPKKRMRGRVSALEWFLDRASVIVPSIEAKAINRPHVENLKRITDKLREVAVARFADKAPALSPMAEAIERLLIDIPAEKPRPAAPTVSERQVGEAVAPAAQPSQLKPVATAPAVSETAPSAVPNKPDTPAETQKYLRRVGDGLLKLARMRRQAQPMDPAGYRLSRVAMWLTIDKPPAVGANGRTMVPPLKKELRVLLANLASSGSWAELLGESEAALSTNRLHLDLQRSSVRALGCLGEPYAPASRVVVAEVRALVERLPALPKLLASDGSPLADDQTMRWLEEEVLATGSGSGSLDQGAPVDDTLIPEELLARAREMVSDGQGAEAVATLQPLVTGASDARASFRVRLVQSDLCRRAGSVEVAKALYQSLEAELTARQLEAWEPDLAVECLLGYLGCIRSTPDETRDKKAEKALCIRLARLKPSLAIELGM
jgi:type VI secretion system protein VasJ